MAIASSFKPGDLVKCINREPAQSITIGKIYKVMRIGEFGSLVIVRDNGKEGGYFVSRFEFFKRVPCSFNVFLQDKGYLSTKGCSFITK